MGSEASKTGEGKSAISKKSAAKLLKLGLRLEEVNHIFNLLQEQHVVPESLIRVRILIDHGMKFHVRCSHLISNDCNLECMERAADTENDGYIRTLPREPLRQEKWKQFNRFNHI